MGFWGTKSVLDRDIGYGKLDYEGYFKEIGYLKNKVGSLKEIEHKI